MRSYMINRALFSSNKQDWKTPTQVYKALNNEFHFDFDPCPVNHDFDGFGVSWGKSNFINPPYKEIYRWISKGFNEYKLGKTCVFLLPSRTGTKWFHDFALKATEIRFIRGRLRFEGAQWDAPFDSCIVIFDNRRNY